MMRPRQVLLITLIQSFAVIMMQYAWYVVLEIERLSPVPPLEVDIPPFPMAKICIDFSGPYKETWRGNKYLLSIAWGAGHKTFQYETKQWHPDLALIKRYYFDAFSSTGNLTKIGPAFISYSFAATSRRLSIVNIRTACYPPQPTV